MKKKKMHTKERKSPMLGLELHIKNTDNQKSLVE